MKGRVAARALLSLLKRYYRTISIGLGLMISVVSFQNCAPVSFSENIMSSKMNDDGLCVGADCVSVPSLTCLFNGETVKEGAEVLAFLNSTVSYGKECESERRICRKGVLSGSYSYASCTVGAPASCLFNGQTIPSGQSVKAYQNSSVAHGSECVEEMRKCENGALSGSYSYSSCSVAGPASCLFNGQTIAHGQSVTAYQTSSVPFGSSCSNQARTCNNGVLSGTYSYSSCSVAGPASCLFNGQTIAHGQTVTAFESSSVPYGNICVNQVRTCNNGSLSGSYAYSTCSVGPKPTAPCTWHGQVVQDGASVQAWAVSVIGDKQTGASYNFEAISEKRTCSNGVLSGTFKCKEFGDLLGDDCTIYYWWDEVPKDSVPWP